MDGARMAWASETEKGRAWAENRIKSLTGGDTITARFMRQDSFSFVPQMKLTIIGNNRPSLTDVDEAIRRRFIVLPFDHPPTNKDTELPAKLKLEWPGILSWLILGALDWDQNGLVRPAMVEDATNEYFYDQDTFGKWLEECCEVGLGFSATTDSLFTSWQQFAHANGTEPGSKMRTFPETMEQREFKKEKNVGPTRGRGFKGLRLMINVEEFTDDLV
jgi:putative DNA primase/helicase